MRFYRHGSDALQQVDDLLFVVGKAEGVELLADRRILGLGLLVLVEDPFERRAVTARILPLLRRCGAGPVGRRDWAEWTLEC